MSRQWYLVIWAIQVERVFVSLVIQIMVKNNFLVKIHRVHNENLANHSWKLWFGLGAVQLRCRKCWFWTDLGQKNAQDEPGNPYKPPRPWKKHALSYDFSVFPVPMLGLDAGNACFGQIFALKTRFWLNQAISTSPPCLEKSCTVLLFWLLSISGAWGLKIQNLNLWWSKPAGGKSAFSLEILIS